MKFILIISMFFSYQVSFSQEIKREREIIECFETKFYDTPPTFMGGDIKMNKFIQKNMKYPPEATRAEIEGTVFIQFKVSEKGNIDSINILKSLGFGCDEEATRIIRLMHKWNPAIDKKHFLATRTTIPIVFKLPKNRKH